MMNARALLLLSLLLHLSATVAAAVSRTWTDGAGRTVEGEYISQTDETVTFKREIDQKIFTIPIATLSAEDRAYLAGRQAEAATGDFQNKGLSILVEFEEDPPESVLYQIRWPEPDSSVVSLTLPAGQPFVSGLSADGHYRLSIHAKGYATQTHTIVRKDKQESLQTPLPRKGEAHRVRMWKSRYLVVSYYVTYGSVPDFSGPEVEFYHVATAHTATPPVLRGDFVTWQGRNESREFGPDTFLSRHRYADGWGHVAIGGSREFNATRRFSPPHAWRTADLPGTAGRAYLIKLHGNSPADHCFVKLHVEGVHEVPPEGVKVYENTLR